MLFSKLKKWRTIQGKESSAELFLPLGKSHARSTVHYQTRKYTTMIEVSNYLNKLRSEVDEVNVDAAFKKQTEGALLIDIREKNEVNDGSPIGAVRIPKGLLEMQITQHLDSNEKEICLICASGQRSLVAAN